MTLETVILDTLRTAGPMLLHEMVWEINQRSMYGLLDLGLVGASAVHAELKALARAGRAKEGRDGWEIVTRQPERPEPSGRTKQAGLFGEH